MRAHRTTRGAVAVIAAALALTPAVTGTADAAAPKDTDVETCIEGGGFPNVVLAPGGVLSSGLKVVCEGGKYNGQPIPDRRLT
ncbi:hypothetical protein LE181_23420 [Streptomyces sp. SCA3-4]|uniref:hypothetical protein n=1 Tax=Streptomyces sichuanensis TaxID=2871810 RepID=UPI001CE2F323|nr:hypothetical protein [Streptomyces sichuanensis]MCA6095110.1 hypothetical protein [Streptomyces sichuanensis]